MNSISARYQRLKIFVSRQRQKGRPLYRIILLYAPQRFLLKSYLAFVAFANDTLISRLFNVPKFIEFQRIHADKLGNHFYIIVMPNTLHFLLPCLKLIPRTVNIFLLLNGVKDWEEDYLKKHCANYPIFKLRGLLHSSLPHGRVLNLLIDHNNSNFGIIDHDLYVFNPAVFAGLEFDKAECAIGVFRLTNQKAGLAFPTTHFLFFNIKRIREIRKKYRVGAQVYARIPARLKPLLDSLGLGYHNFLKEYMHYFDTLNLIFALAFYEKHSIKFLEVSPDDFYHIGGTSSNQGTPFEKYIGLRFLELSQSSVLAQRYASLYGQRTNSRDLWGQLSPVPLPAAFLARVERVVARIERHAL